jgi:nucleoside-triphosphatase THEP1
VKFIIVTGERQSGKSTLLSRLIEILRQKKIKVSGILAIGLWQNGVRSGFDLLDLTDGTVTSLARRKSVNRFQKIPFVFLEKGLRAGHKALCPERCSVSDVLIVDEVGPIELAGKGWAPLLDPLLKLSRPVHIWVVRKGIIQDVCQKWSIIDPFIVNVKEDNAFFKLTNHLLQMVPRHE